MSGPASLSVIFLSCNVRPCKFGCPSLSCPAISVNPRRRPLLALQYDVHCMSHCLSQCISDKRRQSLHWMTARCAMLKKTSPKWGQFWIAVIFKITKSICMISVKEKPIKLISIFIHFYLREGGVYAIGAVCLPVSVSFCEQVCCKRNQPISLLGVLIGTTNWKNWLTCRVAETCNNVDVV